MTYAARSMIVRHPAHGHRPDAPSVPLCLHRGVSSFCRRWHFRGAVNGVKYDFSAFFQRKARPKPCAFKVFTEVDSHGICVCPQVWPRSYIKSALY